MKKSLLLNIMSSTNFELNEKPTGLTEELENISDTVKINPFGYNAVIVGFDPPNGMKWDQYGNLEFIEN